MTLQRLCIPIFGLIHVCGARQIDGETMETVTDFIFLGSKITVDDDAAMRLKILAPSKKSYNQPRQHIKKRHYLADKGPSSQSSGLSSSHVWM